MKVHLNLSGIILRKFLQKWSKRKDLFTYELPHDTFMIVEESLDFSYVDGTGIFHVPSHLFGQYIKIIDDLMESIASGKTDARGVSEYLLSKINSKQ